MKCENCGHKTFIKRSVIELLYIKHCSCGNKIAVCSDCIIKSLLCKSCKRNSKINQLLNEV